MKNFCGKSETSIENPKVPQKLERILRKIEKFCGTSGFSAEDLDLPQKIENFCGKTETSANRDNSKHSASTKCGNVGLFLMDMSDCAAGYLDSRPKIRLAGDGIPEAAGRAKPLMKDLLCGRTLFR